MATTNPFTLSPLKHNAIQFDLVKTDQFLPELKKAITTAKAEIQKIIDLKEPATFENTVKALEVSGQSVTLVSSIFYNLLHAHTNDELQKIAQEYGPTLSDYSSDITLNSQLFSRIKTVADANKDLKLSLEDRQLLKETFSNFSRNGALLAEDKKDRLRQIDAELSKLSPTFSDNLLKATNAFELWITDKKDLDGIPEQTQEAYQENAKAKGKPEAWLVDLHAPNLLPFLQYSTARNLREKLWFAQASKAFSDSFDNQKTILRTLELREERALLLGYKTHAHFVLEKRMAESPEKVFKFLDDLKSVFLPKAKEEIAALEKFAKDLDGIDKLMPWDFSFYAEKMKQKLFHFDSEELRPYFPLDQVEAGVFEHAKRLYNLKFTESKTYPTYHPDVRVYEVNDFDSGQFVGLFYADYFPRPSKNGGAWANGFFEQGLFMGEVRRPHVAIVCNFTKPTETTPSLLTFDEVLTLFHEFGHALHSLLSECHYTSLSGTNVYWDFVELPSQVMENWIKEKEGLDVFAKHYQTGEAMPAALMRKIKDSEKFLAAYFGMRQVQFATLDLKFHTTPVRDIGSVPDFETKAIADLQVLPKVPGTSFSCGFSHIFAGGYSAGYYSYKWAEVLDADAFEYFLEKGIFNREVATKFRKEVLSRGGTEHPMELYKRFRGREPDPKALFRRDGLLQK